METVTVDQHVAVLCVTCADLLRKDTERLKSLVRSKKSHESNHTMQKQHQLLSRFISVGAFGVIVIAGIGVANRFPGLIASAIDYLSLVAFY